MLFTTLFASIAGGIVVWTFSFFLIRDFQTTKFLPTLFLALCFLCAMNIAPFILYIPTVVENLNLIHVVFLISSILTSLSPCFCVLFVSYLVKNGISWWALLFVTVGTTFTMFALVPGATDPIIVSTSIGNVTVLTYKFPFGLMLQYFSYIGTLTASILTAVHCIRILAIRGGNQYNYAVKVFLSFFLSANILYVILNILKRIYPELYGIDTLLWSSLIAVVELIYRKNPKIFYLIRASVKHIVITTKTGLVLSSYDCISCCDLERTKQHSYGGQVLHTITQMLQQALPIESQITQIQSQKGMILFEQGNKFLAYLVVDRYSSLWDQLLKAFCNEIETQFGNKVDGSGVLIGEAPNLDDIICRHWQLFFPKSQPNIRNPLENYTQKNQRNISSEKQSNKE